MNAALNTVLAAAAATLNLIPDDWFDAIESDAANDDHKFMLTFNGIPSERLMLNGRPVAGYNWSGLMVDRLTCAL